MYSNCPLCLQDTNHRNETLAAESKDTPSQNSIDFLSIVKEDSNVHAQRIVTMATIEYNKVFNNEGNVTCVLGFSLKMKIGIFLYPKRYLM